MGVFVLILLKRPGPPTREVIHHDPRQVTNGLEPIPSPHGGVVVGADGVARCPWAAGDAVIRRYHDTEWGVPVRGERGLYERITLEAFQAGLSWLTILNKRPAFRAAFSRFDPDVVAGFQDAELERLMGDPGIVRNRRKIEAARTNARATVSLREHGGLDRLIWAHRPAESPMPHTLADLPTSTAQSSALAADLRAHGFVFVGPTTSYALMEAIGMVDAHLIDCHRRGACERDARR
jgi:DNA-3-methyladenine glycosylase I